MLIKNIKSSVSDTLCNVFFCLGEVKYSVKIPLVNPF